jgi:hypothetical protein
LIFRDKKRIDHLLKIFIKSEFMAINQELVKMILSQVRVNNFKSNIQSHVVMGCKFHLFRCKVALVLKSTEWKGLTGHPKDRGKYSNSKMNSFQPEKTDAGKNQAYDLKIIFLNKISTRIERIKKKYI